MQLSRPGGCLRALAFFQRGVPYAVDRQILHSLDPFLSMTQTLAIKGYRYSGPAKIEECPIFNTLAFTNDLRTLFLIDSHHQPLTRALDPGENGSGLTLCFSMEGLVLYIEFLSLFHGKYLVTMAESRASRGAKLQSIAIVGRGGLVPEGEVLRLKEHVVHVKSGVCDTLPPWDDIPDKSPVESSGLPFILTYKPGNHGWVILVGGMR